MMPKTPTSARDDAPAGLPPTATYAQAYARLLAIAELLRSMDSADVDALAEDIREARAAHAVCRARLDAVRAEIEAELAEPAAAAPP